MGHSGAEHRPPLAVRPLGPVAEHAPAMEQGPATVDRDSEGPPEAEAPENLTARRRSYPAHISSPSDIDRDVMRAERIYQAMHPEAAARPAPPPRVPTLDRIRLSAPGRDLMIPQPSQRSDRVALLTGAALGVMVAAGTWAMIWQFQAEPVPGQPVGTIIPIEQSPRTETSAAGAPSPKSGLTSEQPAVAVAPAAARKSINELPALPETNDVAVTVQLPVIGLLPILEAATEPGGAAPEEFGSAGLPIAVEPSPESGAWHRGDVAGIRDRRTGTGRAGA